MRLQVKYVAMGDEPWFCEATLSSLPQSLPYGIQINNEKAKEKHEFHLLLSQVEEKVIYEHLNIMKICHSKTFA